MKVNELRALPDSELHARLKECYRELFNLRFQHANRKLTNTSRPRQVRGDIARIKTLLRERELAQQG